MCPWPVGLHPPDAGDRRRGPGAQRQAHPPAPVFSTGPPHSAPSSRSRAGPCHRVPPRGRPWPSTSTLAPALHPLTSRTAPEDRGEAGPHSDSGSTGVGDRPEAPRAGSSHSSGDSATGRLTITTADIPNDAKGLTANDWLVPTSPPEPHCHRGRGRARAAAPRHPCSRLRPPEVPRGQHGHADGATLLPLPLSDPTCQHALRSRPQGADLASAPRPPLSCRARPTTAWTFWVTSWLGPAQGHLETRPRGGGSPGQLLKPCVTPVGGASPGPPQSSARPSPWLPSRGQRVSSLVRPSPHSPCAEKGPAVLSRMTTALS